MSAAALDMHKLRDYIDGLPQTAATFKLSYIDDIKPQTFHDIHLEFCGAWPIHDAYATGNSGRTFVNPNYVHAHRFSDLIVDCDCGARIVLNYEQEENPMDNSHNHTEACMTFDRLHARANMNRRRYEEMYRLSWLGWRGSDIYPRFGATSNFMGSVARDFETSMEEVYERYRQTASNTYHLLVNEYSVPPSKIAECYGHAVSTMTRWAKDRTEYNTERGFNQFATTEDGQFEFVQANREGDYVLKRKPVEMQEIETPPELEWDSEAMEYAESQEATTQ